MQNSAPQKSRSRTVRSFAGEKLPRRDEIHLSVRRNSQFEKENSQLFVFPFLAKPPDRMAFIPTTTRQRSRLGKFPVICEELRIWRTPPQTVDGMLPAESFVAKIGIKGQD
jgi:hypothetical protein